MTEPCLRVMALESPDGPLRLRERPMPEPGPGEMIVAVEACGVCRTDLHLLDGELPGIVYPIVPGHQIVGRVWRLGAGVVGYRPGQRVGVPWLGQTCGCCEACTRGQENLCDAAVFTGYTRDGGYATHVRVCADFAVPLSEQAEPVALAPLLCAGLIGYRAYRFCGDARRIGFYGFGAAAHLIAQLAVWEGREVYALTRTGDLAAQSLARELGAAWAGGSDQSPPQPLDAAIIFAAAGELVPTALAAVRKGGTVVCGGIHMSDIPSFPYALLWGERSLRSVAHLTRRDAREFLDLASLVPVRATTRRYRLEQANEALDDLRSGRLRGAAVLDLGGA